MRAGGSGEGTDRSVRNWCSGHSLPNDLKSLEIVLFGPEPLEGSHDGAFSQREALRAAFQFAKFGDRLSSPQHAGLMSAGNPATLTSPGKCFGRGEEITRLVSAITGPGVGAALVLGNAGHGKTMLTRTVGVHPDVIAAFCDRRWFVELERAESATSALAEIAETLGLERTAPLAAVQAVLGHRQMPALLILDNLETPLHAPYQRASTEQLIRDLVGVPNVSLVASLRSQETVAAVEWTDEVLVGPLSPEDSRRMFLSIARTIEAGDPDLDYFVGAEGVLAGIPLAIRLIAHCVFRNSTLAPLRRDWLKQGSLLASLPGGDNTRTESLDASVSLSLTSRRLRPEGRRLFALLGRLPAGLSERDRDLLMPDTGIDATAQLRAVGLLKDSDDGRIGLLTPLRDLARRRFPLDETSTSLWVTHYLRLVATKGAMIGKVGGREAISRLTPEMANISAAIGDALLTTENRFMAIDALDGFERVIYYAGFSAESLLSSMRDVCIAVGDEIGEVKCLIAQASGARRKSDNALATRLYHRAHDLLGSKSEDKLVAKCLYGLAEAARLQDENTAATDFYHQAMFFAKNSGWVAGEAVCAWALAEIALGQNDYPCARELYTQSIALNDRAGLLTCKAECLSGLAEIARQTEDLAPAVPLYEEARELFRAAGWQLGEADCLHGLAVLARLQGDLPAAARLFAEARDLHSHSGAIIGTANGIWGLAEVSRMQMDYETAKLAYRAGGLPLGAGRHFASARR